ncbi:MAG: Lrp/AsnC family transcriptional regulator [Erysipelotrichaceae bacterium]|nr:Lrp/AsnC family transcriptional regulator [Erysipelotrichaceae bacterium]
MDELKLLHWLENDPRISIRDLADILNESEDRIYKMRTRLEREKVICGYHTVINWEKTNEDRVSAIIEVSARPERNSGYEKVANTIANYPEVSSLYLMSGKSEFMVFLEGRTMREIADFVAQRLAPIEGVTSTVTYFILKTYKVDGIVIREDEEKDERLIVTP